MSNDRKKFSPIEQSTLYNQVNGICPLCQKSLSYTKEGKLRKLFEIAHIYPLNPTDDEKVILKDEPVLYEDDVNDLDNLIALCPNCHTQLDKPTSLDSYRKLYQLKIKLIEEDKIRNIYSFYDIEKDIVSIINSMNSDLFDYSEPIDYKLMKVTDKIKPENKFLIHRVKDDVASYYLLIRKLFADLDKNNNSTTFDSIASQIKSFYLKVKTITSDQEQIYNHIAAWLYDKNKIGSIEAYKIIVSFFVQNCEVFSDVSK